MMFDDGVGIEQDSGKTVYLLEEAAIGGLTGARNQLLDTSKGTIMTILESAETLDHRRQTGM